MACPFRGCHGFERTSRFKMPSVPPHGTCYLSFRRDSQLHSPDVQKSLHFLATVPITPAENASQPEPKQAPNEPLVGSKAAPN